MGGDSTEIILLAAAASADMLAAAIGIRSAGIRFTPFSSAAASFAGAAILWLSVILSSAADNILPLDGAVYISKAVLAFIGIRTLLGEICPAKHRKQCKKAVPDCTRVMTDPASYDKDNSQTISAAEGIAIGTALSADSFFAGISAGIGGISPLPTFIMSFLFGLAAIAIGSAAGKRLSELHIYGFPTNRLGGIILIILSVVI